MSCRTSAATGLFSIRAFEYYAARTLQETLSLIEKSGSEAKLIAGGTDLVPLLKLRLVTPRYLVDIGHLGELDFVKLDGKLLRIGALTKHRTLERSPLILERAYILAEAAIQIGSPQIRNMGTVGGNLVNASPCSDTATPLLALGANLKLVKSGGERVVALDEFFLHVKKTVLQNDELLTEVQIPEQPPGTVGAFIKVGRRAGHELSVVSVAASITMDKNVCRSSRIALGSVAPTPIRVKKAESFLVGKSLEEHTINEASEIASQEIRPISDVRASAEYRRDVSKVIVQMAINKAIERIRR
jgi:carbon-monoxide dehydrogenase medium subunit